MDIGLLSADIVAALANSGLASGVAGNAAWDGAKKLSDSLRARFSSFDDTESTAALDTYLGSPDDENAKSEIRKLLESHLSASPEWVKEVQTLLDDIGKAQTINLSAADGVVALQNATSNSVNPVTIRENNSGNVTINTQGSAALQSGIDEMGAKIDALIKSSEQGSDIPTQSSGDKPVPAEKPAVTRATPRSEKPAKNKVRSQWVAAISSLVVMFCAIAYLAVGYLDRSDDEKAGVGSSSVPSETTTSTTIVGNDLIAGPDSEAAADSRVISSDRSDSVAGNNPPTPGDAESVVTKPQTGSVPAVPVTSETMVAPPAPTTATTSVQSAPPVLGSIRAGSYSTGHWRVDLLDSDRCAAAWWTIKGPDGITKFEDGNPGPGQCFNQNHTLLSTRHYATPLEPGPYTITAKLTSDSGVESRTVSTTYVVG